MINLLIAEDDLVPRKILEKFTRGWEYKVFSAGNGEEAKKFLEIHDIHIALLDWMMPKINGIELCRTIRSQNKPEYTYIILLTSMDNQNDIIEGFSAGADDYITKPFNIHELKARISTGKRIIELQKQLIKTQQQLKEIAIHDGLTQLLNRRTIQEITEEEFERAEREKTQLGLIILDVDRFKQINDTYGHQAGDLALKEVARCLKSCVRPYDKIGRYGGEEFLVVLPNCNLAKTKKIAERLRFQISEKKIKTDDGAVQITISLGGTVSGKTHIQSPDEMLKIVDKALYKAKEKGRNCWIVESGYQKIQKKEE